MYNISFMYYIKLLLTVEIYMYLLYQSRVLSLVNFYSWRLSRDSREKEKDCKRRQLDIRQWNLRNSRTCPFDILTGEYACNGMYTRRIPSDKSSADATGNCICNVRKLQASFTGESKKAKHEESQGQPVAITCSSLQPRSLQVIIASIRCSVGFT